MGTKKRVEVLDRCRLKLNRIGARGSRAFNLIKGEAMNKEQFEAALSADMAIAQAHIMSGMPKFPHVDGHVPVDVIQDIVETVAKQMFKFGFGAGAESCAKLVGIMISDNEEQS